MIYADVPSVLDLWLEAGNVPTFGLLPSFCRCPDYLHAPSTWLGQPTVHCFTASGFVLWPCALRASIPNASFQVTDLGEETTPEHMMAVQDC